MPPRSSATPSLFGGTDFNEVLNAFIVGQSLKEQRRQREGLVIGSAVNAFKAGDVELGQQLLGQTAGGRDIQANLAALTLPGIPESFPGIPKERISPGTEELIAGRGEVPGLDEITGPAFLAIKKIQETDELIREEGLGGLPSFERDPGTGRVEKRLPGPLRTTRGTIEAARKAQQGGVQPIGVPELLEGRQPALPREQGGLIQDPVSKQFFTPQQLLSLTPAAAPQGAAPATARQPLSAVEELLRRSREFDRPLGTPEEQRGELSKRSLAKRKEISAEFDERRQAAPERIAAEQARIDKEFTDTEITERNREFLLRELLQPEKAESAFTKTVRGIQKAQEQEALARVAEARKVDEARRAEAKLGLDVEKGKRGEAQLEQQRQLLRQGKREFELRFKLELEDRKAAAKLAGAVAKKETIDKQGEFFTQRSKDSDANKKFNLSQLGRGVIPRTSSLIVVARRELQRIAVENGLPVQSIGVVPGGPSRLSAIDQSFNEGALTAEMEIAVSKTFPRNAQKAIRFFNKTIEEATAARFAQLALGDQVATGRINLLIRSAKLLPVSERAGIAGQILAIAREATELPLDLTQSQEEGWVNIVLKAIASTGTVGVNVVGDVLSGLAGLLFGGEKASRPAPPTFPAPPAGTKAQQRSALEDEFLIPSQ